MVMIEYVHMSVKSLLYISDNFWVIISKLGASGERRCCAYIGQTCRDDQHSLSRGLGYNLSHMLIKQKEAENQ